MNDFKFTAGEVVGTDDCECCGFENEIKLDKNLRAYTVCQNRIKKPLCELSGKDRQKRIQPLVPCNRKVWFSWAETAALKAEFLEYVKEAAE